MADDRSKNVQASTDQIVKDAVNEGMNWDLQPDSPDVQNPPQVPQQPDNQPVVADPVVVQEPEQHPMNVTPQSGLPPQQDPAGQQPQPPGPAQQQSPYFQTPNSTYLTEDQMKSGMVAKDQYIAELQGRERVYQDILRNQQNVPQSPVQPQAPAPPPQKTKEQLDAEFESFRETHGDREAMMIMAENIADQKLADRDRQTAQHRSETQGFVDDFHRRNPQVTPAQIQALRTKYEELYDQPNFNPIDILHNPGVQPPPPPPQPQPNYPGGGNGNPVYPTNAAPYPGTQQPYPGQYPNPAVINQDNQQYRQQIGGMRKNFIPRSPQTVSQADNQLMQVNERLKQNVAAGDVEKATFDVFDQATVQAQIQAGRGRF